MKIPQDEKQDSSSVKQIKCFILLVDDEPINILLLEKIISQDENVKIYKAENGKIAVDICSNNDDIGLVFMDIKMPVMNGIEATKLIKSKKPEILIVAQSAYTSESDKNAALEAGCVSFISKPISKDTIVNIIDGFRSQKLLE